MDCGRDRTAQALAQYGISAEVPKVETSEGMLQLPVLQTLNSGQCLAFWRGEGGRMFDYGPVQNSKACKF